MHFFNDHARFEMLEVLLDDLIKTAQKMPDYADCAETSRPECLRMQADLLDVLDHVQTVRTQYLGRKFTPLTPELAASVAQDALRVREEAS